MWLSWLDICGLSCGQDVHKTHSTSTFHARSEIFALPATHIDVTRPVADIDPQTIVTECLKSIIQAGHGQAQSHHA